MALVVTYISGTFWSSATSTPSLSNVTLSAGDLLVGFCLQDAPFDNRAVSNATWNSVTMSSCVELLGSGSDPYPWLAGAAFELQAASSTVATLQFNLAGNAAKGAIVAYKATGFNTSTPIGDTDSRQTATVVDTLTLSGSSGDMALYGVTSDMTSADRWLEINNSTTQDYNSDPRPGNVGNSKIAVGSKALTGSSVTLGFTSRGFDAGPIDVNWEKVAIGLVIQQAAGASASITAANTLGAATSSATVKGLAGITSARTLGTLTSSATISEPRNITAAQTLGQLGSVANLILIDPAQANNTLGQMTSSAQVQGIAGITSAPTLGAVTSVAGLNVTTVSAAQTLGTLTSSAVVDGVASITSAKTLGDATAAAFIAPASYITGSASLDAMVSSAVVAHGHVMRARWSRKSSNAGNWTRRA